ncbi:hypothetical protein NESM_000539200 [Novymonas esmeraldas]|uniref:Uncharacterized protein n=1 Tax=Novymonas esmeraldas TaxID=1808958 RepID=A0AAW0EPN6_9TRYP
MESVAAALHVDTYVAPRINASYRRANGEAPLSRSRAADNTPLPAALRGQLQCLTEEDVCALERRMEREARAAEHDRRAAARVARVSTEAHAAAEQRSHQLRQRAARHSKVAGEVCAKKVQEDYRTMRM